MHFRLLTYSLITISLSVSLKIHRIGTYALPPPSYLTSSMSPLKVLRKTTIRLPRQKPQKKQHRLKLQSRPGQRREPKQIQESEQKQGACMQRNLSLLPAVTAKSLKLSPAASDGDTTLLGGCHCFAVNGATAHLTVCWQQPTFTQNPQKVDQPTRL